MSGQALSSAALAIGAKGKPVFPVGINKRPLTAHGFKDATTDPDAIRALFSMQGVAGIGMPTGPASGLLVIDRDRKNGVDGIAACQELEADLGRLPETLRQRTGSGGDQLFFLYPDGADIPCSAGKVGPGIDIRSAGGYVVLPPSVNEAGPYVWLNRLQPAPLPQSWIDRLARKPRPEQPRQCPTISATLSTCYGAAALEKECRELAAMGPNTGRNVRLNGAAFACGQLVAGGELLESEALTALEQAAAACGLPDHEAQRTIQSGFSAGLAEPRQGGAMSETLQYAENKSGRSGRSGQGTVDAGFIDPTTEKPKSGRSGQVGSGRVQLPNGYHMNAEGLWYIEDPEKPEEKTWLGAPIYFQAMTRNGDSEAWGLLIGWHDPDGKLHWWAMPYAMLNDTRQSWRAELASGGWRGATGQKAKGLLGQLLASVSVQARARCVDRAGWHGSAYVRPDAVIGQGEERLVLQATMAANPFTQAGTLEDWNATIGAWAMKNRLLMFGISAALSGFLLDLAGMDSGGFHFWGHSSTGKTTIMRAAWSVHGAPSGVRTWRSTANALEAISDLHNDACLCLDEIGQASGRVVSEAAYLLGNGQGKSRAHVDGSARALRAWRCAVLSNGEMTLSDKLREDGQQVRAGQEVRIIDLSADAGSGMGAWQDLHGHDTPGQFSDAIKAACAANYGTLSGAYIDVLTRSRGELNLAQDLAAVVSAWTPPGSSGQVRRVIDRFALAGVAGELAVDFGLVPWAEGEALAAARQCLESWLEGRGSTGDQEDRRAVDTVRAFIARFGSSRFQNIDPGTPERILDRAGFRRTLNGQAQFLFTSDQFKAVLGGLNQTTAAKALDRAGLLHRNDGKNLTVRVPLPDLGKVRVYSVTMPDDEGSQSC